MSFPLFSDLLDNG